MRLELTLSDDLYREISTAASHSACTVGQLIEHVLERAFGSMPAQPPVDALPTFGGSGLRPGISQANMGGLFDN